MKKIILGWLVANIALISACGQKGNLYLPAPAVPSPITSASAPSK